MKKIYFDTDETVGGGYVDTKAMSAVEREILYNYRAVLDRIKRELEKLAEKIGTDGVITYADMMKYGRLQTLTYNINQEISALIKTTGQTITNFSAETMGTAYKRLAYQINKAVSSGSGANIEFRWGIIDSATIRASVTNPLYLTAMEGIKADTILAVKREITQSLIAGDNYFQMAKKIKERMDVSAGRARTIARTEAGKAFSEGQNAAHDRAVELGIECHKVWQSTLDGKTRDSHRSMDLQVADADGNFKLPGGTLTPGPRLAGPAREVVNCRCRTVTVVEGFEPTKRMSRDIKKGEQSEVELQTYDDWIKTQKTA